MAKIKTTLRYRGHDHPFKPRKINSRAFRQVYWPYLPVIAVISLLLSLGMRQASFRTALMHPTSSVLAYATSMADQKLLASTNQQRISNKTPVLRYSSQLDAAADAKAQDMALRNYWSHNTPDGKDPWLFVTAESYAYQKLGENLATGFADEKAAVDGWMASPSHKDNLLDSAFSEVGFGVAQVTNYSAAGGGPMTVVVAFYGKPAGNQPVIAEVKGDNSAASVSVAQLAVAKLPIVGLATNLAILLGAVSIGLWLGRHLRVLRRALATGERFVFTHPFLDVGLLIIAALAYLLTRTAGLIH